MAGKTIEAPDWVPPPLDDRALSWLQVDAGTTAGKLLPAIREEALGLCRPAARAVWIKRGVFLRLLAASAGESRAVGRLLDGCDGVWLMATIGDGIEGRARNLLRRRESFHGYILDRLGSFWIEALIDDLDAAVETHCEASGLSATRRYSPGYRDFGLEAQPILVRLMGDDAFLEVTAGLLLTPEKSITAVKGCRPLPVSEGLFKVP